MNRTDGSDDAMIVVVGAGALGSGLAAILQSFGCEVLLTGRDGVIHEQRVLRQIHGSPLVYRMPTGLKITADRPKIFFLATKAYDLESVLQSYRSTFAADSIVISLSNGYLKPILQKQNVPCLRWGVATFGVKKISQSEYETGDLNASELRWGHVPGITPDFPISISEVWLQSKISQLEFDANVESRIAEKWVFNTALNTICGVYRLQKNGLALSDHQNELRQLFKEAYQCSDQLFSSANLKDEEWLWEKLKVLIEKTSENANSMFVDLQAGRRTETDFLAGACINSGENSLLKILHQHLCQF